MNQQSATPKKNAFDWGTSRDRQQSATPLPASGCEAASGPKSAPPELLSFIHSQSVRDAAAALKLSLPTIHGLRHGYWPDDARRILRAWSDYKGRTGRIESSWFLRRVHPGGSIAHAGRRWSGVGLAQRVGELVAVARLPDGQLLAQTLELPAQRLPLEAAP